MKGFFRDPQTGAAFKNNFHGLFPQKGGVRQVMGGGEDDQSLAVFLRPDRLNLHRDIGGEVPGETDNGLMAFCQPLDVYKRQDHT